jgi:hypothetical protein
MIHFYNQYITNIVSTRRDMPDCFEKISQDPDCRSVVLSAAGRLFTAGLANDQFNGTSFFFILLSLSSDCSFCCNKCAIYQYIYIYCGCS